MGFAPCDIKVSIDITVSDETVAGITGFSDSPGADYENHADASLTLPAIQIDSEEVTLVVKARYSFEAGYDFGYIETSTDGGRTWVELDKLTGSSDWSMLSYPLDALLTQGTQLTVRFRVTSDFSITRDGWLIDELQVFAPVQ